MCMQMGTHMLTALAWWSVDHWQELRLYVLWLGESKEGVINRAQSREVVTSDAREHRQRGLQLG